MSVIDAIVGVFGMPDARLHPKGVMQMKFRNMAVFVAALIGTACASRGGQEVAKEQPKFPEPRPYQTRHIALDIDPSLEDCGLLQVHFFYDEAEAQPQDHPPLEALAKCLNSAPRREHRVKLVGHADAHGTDRYNDKLAYQRAAYVKNVLVRNGVAASRLKIESRGEHNAKGYLADYSHGHDRRVDVVEVHTIAPR
jgi:outer membrane protein OmpA-like peptidoglycan-associated protein